MDTVSIITTSGRSFKLNRAVLKKHSGYFDHRFGDSVTEKTVDLPGVSDDAFSFLETYFVKNELNLMDKGLQLLTEVTDVACALGISAFPKDLEKTMKVCWSKMTNLDVVFNLASRLAIHSAMVHTIVDDVLKIMLGDKETGGLREVDLNYEILIFTLRLEKFWEELYLRCKYYYTYERFFNNIISWVVKNSTDEYNIIVLVDVLRVHTVPFKFLSDCIANALGIPDTKELLKIVLQKKSQDLHNKLLGYVRNFKVSWFDAKQNDVCTHSYNGEKFNWEETLRFPRAPLDTNFCAVSEDYVYALGGQTLTSVRIQGGAPVFIKYPERLEINYCFAYSSSLFFFGWNRRYHVMYEFNSESRKFEFHGPLPLDSNFVATTAGNELYVLGEVLHSSVRNNELKVFKYNSKDKMFSWLAILKKAWSQPELTSDLDVKETPSNYKTHLVFSDGKLYAFVQEFCSSVGSELYSFSFESESTNCSQIEPRKHMLPLLFDKHNVLVGLQSHPKGIVLLFKSPYKGDYSLAILDQWKREINLLGYLPHFANAQNTSANYLMMPQIFPVTIYLPKPDSTAVESEKKEEPNLLTTDARSDDTLVNHGDQFPELNLNEYNSEDERAVLNGTDNRDVLDTNRDFSRPVSRFSTSTAHSYSSRTSRRSKKGSKKSLASKAVSLMTSLVK